MVLPVVVAALIAVAAAAWWFVLKDTTIDPVVAHSDVRVVRAGELQLTPPAARTTDAYRGYGAWVDVFDYSPSYSAPDEPYLAPTVVDEMADHGVRTLYLQSSRIDAGGDSAVLEDPWLLAEFLLRAHRVDMDVVGWYLPRWADDGEDLNRLRATSQFAVLGHRLDGVAVDIEFIGDGLEPAERSRRLVTLSHAVASLAPGEALGAIVPPPVQTEVINPRFWPGFPWREIEPLYDVWMPMSYWSFRQRSSGYHDGYTYNEESVRRLRTNIGRPDALVHSIGGIGATDGIDDDPEPEEPLASIDDLAPFAQSLRDTGSVGGSIYDWRTMEPPARTRMSELMRATFR